MITKKKAPDKGVKEESFYTKFENQALMNHQNTIKTLDFGLRGDKFNEFVNDGIIINRDKVLMELELLINNPKVFLIKDKLELAETTIRNRIVIVVLKIEAKT